jgi:hypothetical protein
MPVATPLQPDYNTQSGTAYPLAIDASIAAAKRLAWAFAPHEQATPVMTVRLEAGFVLSSALALAEVAAQSTGTITAPAGNPRIDRIVIDRLTGAVSVVTGTPAGSPTPPAIPSGKRPVAQVLLQTSSTVITNSMLTDERVQSTPTPLTAAEIGAVGLTGDETIAGGKTFSSDVTITKTTPILTINESSGSGQGVLRFLDNGATRWQLIKNSDDQFWIYNDGRGIADIGITDSTGLITLGSGQLKFPATQNASADANTLDDYEEGTWTPSLGGSTTYSEQIGSYTKSGRGILADFSLLISSIGSGSTTTISGGPFTAGSDGALAVQRLVNSVTAVVSVQVGVAISSTAFAMRSRTAAAASDAEIAIFQNSTQLIAGGSYRV